MVFPAKLKLMTLNDPEWHNCHYFALFYLIWQLWEPSALKRCTPYLKAKIRLGQHWAAISAMAELLSILVNCVEHTAATVSLKFLSLQNSAEIISSNMVSTVHWLINNQLNHHHHHHHHHHHGISRAPITLTTQMHYRVIEVCGLKTSRWKMLC